jgi:hypothetical protein
MKRLIASLIVLFALSATPVMAETVKTCRSIYGGGEVCGETTVEHKTVETGVSDLEMWQILSIVGGVALTATALYKLSYRWYIFG